MRRFLIGLTVSIAASTCMPLFSQTNLDSLERQIRGKTGQGERIPAPAPTTENGPTISGGRIEPGYLGLTADDAADRGRGVRVTDVYLGGPAEAAGLRKGDLITAMLGVRIRQTGDLAKIIEVCPPGSEADVEIVRDGSTTKLTVTFGSRPLKPPMVRDVTGPSSAPANTPTRRISPPSDESFPLLAMPEEPGAKSKRAPGGTFDVGDDPRLVIASLQLRIEELERRTGELERELAKLKKEK